MKKNILIILNAVVYNRGSEALVRGISYICKKYNKDSFITLVSSETEFGSWISIENIDNYVKKVKYSNKSILKYIVAILQKLKLKNIANSIKYSNIKNIAKEQDVIIIIGADNYDISYNMQEKLREFNTFVKKNTNAKMILYDCSISQKDITDNLKEDLNNFNYITVRESVTEQNVKEIIPKDKLNYYPDPAFVMNIQQVELPRIFSKGKVIGVNVSNLITNEKYGSRAEKVVNAYKNMIKYILDTTEYNLILIPHVMKNADLATLKVLYEDFKENDRVELISNEKLNAKELKYIISKCEMFIGARTHSTIAAYSTCVPTLVLGYSVKSKGIAVDLFGTSDKYVLPVENLDSEDYLLEGFKWLYSNRKDIKKKLENIMPEYKKRAEAVIEIIK